MPFKSRAQQGYMHAAADRGEIPRKVVEEFDRESKGKKLPERSGKRSNLLESRKDKRSNMMGNPGY